MTLVSSQVYEFEYVNHEGRDATRRIIFGAVDFGVVQPHYLTPTFLLRGYDLDKRQYRSFDISKVRNLRYDGRSFAFGGFA